MKTKRVLAITFLLSLSMFVQGKNAPDPGGNIQPNGNNVIFVKPDALEGQTGTDWENASTLSEALAYINGQPLTAVNAPFHLWLGKGTYLTKDTAFFIGNNVNVWGGFDGENDPNEVVATPEMTELTRGGSQNRILIVYKKNTDLKVTLRNFTISRGIAYDEVPGCTLSSGTTKYRGGGLFAANVNLSLSQMIVRDNQADEGENKVDNGQAARGGGIYCLNKSLFLDGCVVENNVAGSGVKYGGTGGGIYVSDGCDLTVMNSSILYNKAVKGGEGDGLGGGCYTYGGGMHEFKNVTIHGNIATEGKGGGQGGGVFFYNGKQQMKEGVVLKGNIATTGDGTGQGGGIYADLNDSENVLELIGVKIEENIGIHSELNKEEGEGGGVYLENGRLKISAASEIKGNIATQALGEGRGGGLYIRSGSQELAIEDSYVTENYAVANEHNSEHGFGGGIYVNGRDMKLSNVTLGDNVATQGVGNGSGGGLYAISGTKSIFVSKSRIENNRAIANETNAAPGNGGGIRLISGILQIEYSWITGNSATNGLGYGYGGGLNTISDKDVDVIHSLIADNSAGEKGLGGGLFNQAGQSLVFTNVTIAGNSAGSEAHGGGGGGIYNYDDGKIELRNTIVWYNTKDDLSNDGTLSNITLSPSDGSSTHNYSLVSGFEDTNASLNGKMYMGEKNYPMFVDPEKGNYRLCTTSPLLGLANDIYLSTEKKDLDGNLRMDTWDLGAYESNPLTVSLSPEYGFFYIVSDTKYRKKVQTKATENGKYEVNYMQSFVFDVLPAPGYLGGYVKVGGNLIMPESGCTYIIRDITSNVLVEVGGFYPLPPSPPPLVSDPEPNLSGTAEIVDEEMRLYGGQGVLFIEVDRPSEVMVYTIAGQLYTRRSLSAGVTSIEMRPGIYLIRLKDKVYKIIL